MTALAPLAEAMLRVLFSARPQDVDVDLLAPDPELARERERVFLYRELARHRIHEVVRLAFPRTLASLSDGSARVDAWLAAELPQSRFFRDLPLAFATHLGAALGEAERCAASGSAEIARADANPGAPPYAADLLRLEAARWRAMIAVEDDAPVVAFDLEKVPIVSATLTLLAPSWSVQLDGEPNLAPCVVSVHRRADHVVETRWYERVPGLLVEAWARADRSAIDGVRVVLEAEGRSADHAFVERMSQLLTTLLERGLLRGSRID